MTRICLYFILLVVTLSSCVPAKKLVFLQKDDLKNRNAIPKDTILRTHPLEIREYRIQPLDMLNVTFKTLSDESDEFDFLAKLSPQRTSGGGGGSSNQNGIVVEPNGEIEYAVLGRIKVAGLNIFQAQDSIRKVALKYMPDVIVRVRITNFRFTVLGEVNSEQTVTSSTTRLTMMEAIGLSGGLTEFADRTHVKIVRQVGSNARIFYVNLLKEDFMESPYYYVQQNDIIIVPPLRQRTFRKYFTGNLGIITTTLSFMILMYSLATR